MTSELPSTAEISSLALSRLLDLCLKPRAELSEEELAGLFQEVLGGACAFDLTRLPQEKARAVREACEQEGILSVKSLRALLSSPAPPLELLYAVKEFAKACRMSPISELPDAVASALYFLTVAIARRQGGPRSADFSSMSEEELRCGIQWVLAQPWIEPGIKGLVS